MRVLREIQHPDCRITIFNWNNRYLIKLEQGLLEQTFKVHEYDVKGDEDLPKLLDELFIQEALERFSGMSKSITEALRRS